MSEIDPGKAERVWSRVMNAQNSQPLPNTPTSRQNGELSGEKLAELIAAELRSSSLYRTLSCMAGGRCRKTLQYIAGQERCHAKKLAVMYYLTTGRKFCPSGTNPACTACLNEALRQAYQDELHDEKNYELLAQTAGSHACTLQQIAQQEAMHARLLACILQSTL
ncbi:MAG: hypothetical protein MJ118_02025 [Clostridia bacterium]|nr:hypothetical protein [Clostridia bacterium]